VKLSLPVAGSRRVPADGEWDHHGTLDATAMIVDVIASLSSALCRPVNHEMSWQVDDVTGPVWAATAHELRAINASGETTETRATRRQPPPPLGPPFTADHQPSPGRQTGEQMRRAEIEMRFQSTSNCY